MAKEFPVPPVVFTPSTPTHRRHPPPGTGPSPPPAFAPPRPSTSSGANPLPFMSFDVGNAATSSSPPLFAGPIGVGGSGASFEDEPPLLEELGINTRQIWRKTLSILHPLRSADPSLHADADLSGPFLFLLSFGLFQLLAGKFHFGIVLGSCSGFFCRMKWRAANLPVAGVVLVCFAGQQIITPVGRFCVMICSFFTP
ncbi:hypothetical protein DAI22_03g138900 [Oryza sativa Japonica Group]|nr:hypothetical protein DAI22_03g138900 [Oryza sativa Japonica Group]